MSSFRKNVMLGATVLVGLCLFGFMVIKFGSVPARWFAPARIPVELHVARADGVSAGSPVTYLGVNLGNVTGVRRTADQKEVIIDALIDAKNPPPGNVIGHIRTQIVGGGGSVSLELPPGESMKGSLSAHAQIPSTFLGTDLLPAEFGELAVELRVLTKELRDAKVVEHFDQTLLAVRTQLEKAGKLIDSLDQTVSDPKMREDLRASLANFHTATESATKVGANLEKFSANLDTLGQKFGSVADNANSTIGKTQAHVDDLAKRLDDRLLQVAKLLESIQSVTTKIDQGKGTAGMLVNDTKLYESLVDTSRELTLTIRELKLLVQQWTDEGVHLKLK